MVTLGLTWVRIAEFFWAKIEPHPGQFDWAWLHEDVNTLGGAGLKVILCTPTAAPPKWLVDLYPEILPVDVKGVPPIARTISRWIGMRRFPAWVFILTSSANIRIWTAMPWCWHRIC